MLEPLLRNGRERCRALLQPRGEGEGLGREITHAAAPAAVQTGVEAFRALQGDERASPRN